MKTLLKNTNYGYIAIENEYITYVGDKLPEGSFDSVKDMSGKLIFPGFYNTHCHAAMTLFRGYANDLPLHDWLFNNIFPIEDKLRPFDVRVGTQLAMLEMLSTGTVAFSDMYFIYDDTMDAIVDSGMKANVARSVQSAGADDIYAESYRVKEAKELFKTWHGAGEGRLLIDYAIHAEYTNNREMIEGLSEDCYNAGARMHVHLSETKSEVDNCIEKYGMTPLQLFKECGMLKNPVQAAHCVWVTDEDIAIMKEFDVAALHCPSSNLKLASGFAPVHRMAVAGVTVGIGTDGASSNNNLNMIEEMHLASIIHKGYNYDSTLLPAPQILKMATENGAKIMGRNDCGKIEAGCRADMIAIDLDAPHLHPNLDNNSLLIYSAQGSDVCMTMVDGRILYENGEFFTIDKEKVYAEVKESVKHLYA